MGTTIGAIKRDTRSVDYSSYAWLYELTTSHNTPVALQSYSQAEAQPAKRALLQKLSANPMVSRGTYFAT